MFSVKSLEMGIRALCAEVAHTSRGRPWPGAGCRPELIYPPGRPLNKDTSACSVLAWAQDNQGKHSGNLAAVSSSTQTTCVFRRGRGLITTRGIKGTDQLCSAAPWSAQQTHRNRPQRDTAGETPLRGQAYTEAPGMSQSTRSVGRSRA